MVLKLIGHPVSTCTKRVVTVLNEKGVQFELQRMFSNVPPLYLLLYFFNTAINFEKADHKQPEYLDTKNVSHCCEKNSLTKTCNQPFGQIPVLVDGDFVLYESRAICRYIARKYANQGTALIPSDEKELAIFDQAASVE